MPENPKEPEFDPAASVREMQKAAASMARMSESYEVAQQEISKLYRIRYLQLIAAGFSEEQAIRVIMARGLE